MNWKWVSPKRLLWAPSFRIAYMAGFVAPLILLAWAFVDAYFWQTARTSLGIIGIGRPYVDTLATAWRWQGARLLVLPSLITISVLAAGVVAVRLFFGTKRDRSLLSWMLATLLIGVWFGALLGVARYPDVQVCYRLRRDLWRYKIVADAITSAGRIPNSAKTEIGEIRCDTVDTGRFPSSFRPDDQESAYEEIGRIWTLDDGALLFTIYPSRVALEFHPRGTRPGQRNSKPKSGLEGIIVPYFEELGDGWFLVKRHQP